MENNESYKLTEEEVKEISETLESESNIIDFPGKVETPVETEDGESVLANVVVDPNTGEKRIESIEEDTTKSFDDRLSDLGSSINTDFNTDYEIEKEDVLEAAKDQSFIYDEDFKISDQTALEFVSIINNYRKTEKVTYKELPLEARQYIDKYLAKEGIVGFDLRANSIRNSCADMLVEGMKHNIEINKFDSEFQSKLEDMFGTLNDELSPVFLDYNNSREETLKKMQEKVEDPEKKKLIEDLLDTIHETYSCQRLIDAAPKTKIKNYDLEKPEKVFRDVHFKYENNQFHMYDLRMLCGLLEKHLKLNKLIPEDDKYSAIKVMIVFAKLVKNYNVNKPLDHAFMYYTAYSIILLDMYHGDEYNKYAKEFLSNIMKVIENIKKK